MTHQDLMKRTLICTIAFFVIAMTAMITLSINRVITIEGVAMDEIHPKKQTVQASRETMALSFSDGEADSSYLRIPLPDNSRADQIVIENHYVDQELRIYIPDQEADFYETEQISGDRSAVINGTYNKEETGVVLSFKLNGVYECRTIFEEQNLYISFLAPKEVYEKIIVVDAACGGSDYGSATEGISEKNINLKVAEKLKLKLDETDIKVYYTRINDSYIEDAQRITLGNETKADFYIRIECNHSDDKKMYGTEAVYNGNYFIPEFGNVEMADLLEREVTTAVRGKARGLVEAGTEDVVLENLKIPAAAIRIGYLSNAQEAILLQRDDYADRIAEGIYQAVLQAYQ